MPKPISGQYPGRVVLVGRVPENYKFCGDTCDKNIYLMVTAFGGRSHASKDRKLEMSPEGNGYVNVLRTDGKFDPARTYTTMIAYSRKPLHDIVIGGNGIHTDIAFSQYIGGTKLEDAIRISLESMGPEFDGPNDTRQTPRIIAGVDIKNNHEQAWLGMISKVDLGASIFRKNLSKLEPGELVGLTTYDPNTPDIDIREYEVDDMYKMQLTETTPEKVAGELYSLMEKQKIQFDDGTEDSTIAGLSLIGWNKGECIHPLITIDKRNRDQF